MTTGKAGFLIKINELVLERIHGRSDICIIGPKLM